MKKIFAIFLAAAIGIVAAEFKLGSLLAQSLTTVSPESTDSAIRLAQKQTEGIARITGSMKWVRLPLVLTNGTYSSNALMGPILCLTNIAANTQAIVRDVTITYRDNALVPLALVFFATPPTNGTYVDGTAISYGGDVTNRTATITTDMLLTNRFSVEYSGGAATLSGPPINVDYPTTQPHGYLAVVCKGSYTVTNPPIIWLGLQ